MVGVGVHPDAEDLAVLAQRQLTVEVDVAGEAGRDQVARAVLDPLHRPLGEDRGQDRHHVARVDGHLVAEAATEVGADDPDHVLGQLRHQRHGGADDVRRLGGHVDGQLLRRPVEVGDRAAALHRRGVRARVVQLELRDDVSVGERPVGGLLVADLPREAGVVGLVLLVVADDRRVRGHRLGRVHDHREGFVLDPDRLAAVLGGVGVVGDDAGDLLALEPDLVGGQHRLGVVGQRGHPGEVAGRHHLAGEDQAYAGDRVGRAGVDGLDPRVRQGAAQDLHVQHPGQHDVVDVVALAADEPVVLDPLAAGPHPADLDLVERPALLRGRHGCLSPLLGGGPEDRLDDVLVAGAAAQVARQREADLVLGGVRVLGEQRLRGEHHPRRAEAALEAVLLREPLLDRVQLARRTEPLDGGDLVAVGLDGEHRAALHRGAVHEDGAGTAVGGVAAGVGAGEPEPLAQQVREQQPRLDVGGTPFTVDGDRDPAHRDGVVRCGRGDLVEETGHAALS